jgi:chromosome segregation ATPase
MDQALAQALDTAAAKARAEADEGLQQWKQTAEEQEAIARQSLAEVEHGFAAIKGQIEDTITAAEQRLQALQNRIDETASAIEQELSQTVSAAEAQARAAAEAEREQWKQAAEAEDTKTQALLSALEASLTHSQQQVSDAIAQTGQELERLHDRIGEATTRIDQEMAQALSIAEAKARTMGDMHFETWKQAAEEQAATARQILTAMEGSFADTKRQIGDDLTAAEQQFQALQNRIDETAATIEQELSQVVSAAEAKARAAAEAEREQWKQSVEAADTKTQTLLAALEAVSEATKTQAAQEHTAIEARLQEVQAYTDGAIGMVRSQVEQTLRDTEQQILQDAQAKLEPWKQAVQEEDTKAQTLLAALEVAAAETKVRLDAEGTALEQRLTAFQGYTDESISVLRTQVAQKLQDMDQQAREHTDAQLTAWTQTLQAADTKARAELAALEASLAHTKQQVSDTITAVEQQFQALQNRIGEGASHIEQELVQAVGTAEAKARVLADAGLEQWKQTTAIEEAKARQILTDMEKSFAQTRQQAGEALASAEQRVETLQTKMDAAASQLEHTMTQVLGNTETQARAMADTGLEQWRAAMEVEAAAAQGLLSTLETTATETKAQVAAEQAALEQRLKDVQGYAEAAFAGLKAQVEQTLKDMEQQVLDDAQVQLEHWKQTAAEEDAKTQALLSALEATSAEAKTYLEAENDALEQRLKDLRLYADEAIDALRTQVEAQLEQVRQTVAAEDAQAHALLSAMETSFADTKRQASDEIAVAERYLETLQSRMSETAAFIEDEMARTVERAEAQALAANQEGIQRWNQAVETSHTQIRQMLADLEASARGIEQNMLNETESVKQRLQDMRTYTDDSLIQLQQRLRDLTEETEQRVLEDADAKFEEYRKAQAEQFERMEALADDSSALDTELRRYLQDLETRVREDFARFERQARLDQDKVAGEFNLSSTALRSELEGIENELATLKTQAYEQVSAGLRIFEDAFAADLTKRSSDIDQQLTAWQQTLDTRLTDIGVAAEAQRREVELRFNDTLQTKLAEEDGRIKAELERLHREAENFETEIRAQMHGVDETITAFKGQLQQDMDEAHQKTQALLTESDERLGALRTAIEQVAAEAGAQQATVFSHIDTQAKTLEAAIAEADQHIKEFTAQTQLFEQADMLKRELDQRIAGLTADFDRLDKRRAETADMEDQFTKLKRLEEDVNAKMTRFLSEKHRIEQIETGFNRLLLVSEAVEDKLTAVSASNDTLQEMQIQIRKLTDALENAEEKYQRIEKKNQALDVTNDGIDRNFRALQESEKMAQYITDDLHRLSDETGALRAALETLTTENKKARETADKLSLLDQSLSSIEERIEDMQKARKWLAELETRLEKLNKEAQDQVKLMGGLMKDPSKIAPQDKGAPPLGVRDNIIRLARLGWTVDEIARAVKCGKGEVELILEIMPKE